MEYKCLAKNSLGGSDGSITLYGWYQELKFVSRAKIQVHNSCNEWLATFVIAEIPPPTTSPTTTAIPTDSSTPIGRKNTPDTTRRQNHTKNRKKGTRLNGKCSFFASIASSSKLQGRRHRKNQRNLGDVHFTDRRQATSFAAGEDMGEANTLSIAMFGLPFDRTPIRSLAFQIRQLALTRGDSTLHNLRNYFCIESCPGF